MIGPDEEAPVDITPAIVRRRRLTRGRAAAAAVVLALAGLWAARHPIAEAFVDRTLAAKGVAARYRITKLALGRQVLDDVSIGDPHVPDLTARRVVLTIELGRRGPYVKRIFAEGVRLKARIVDGRLTLGAVDRLLPAPSGGPFALPDLEVALRDAAMRLETPLGPVVLAVTGEGNLANGFAGRIAARAATLGRAGCRIEAMTARLNVTVSKRRPALDGPVRARAIDCGGVRVARPVLALDAVLGAALDRWDGAVVADLGGVALQGLRLGRTGGRIGFVGDARRTTGILQLSAAGLQARAGAAATLAIDGRYLALPRAQAGRFEGRIEAGRVVPAAALPARITHVAAGAAGTPVASIAAALAEATRAAARSLDVGALVVAQARGSSGVVRMTRLTVTSASGLRAGAMGDFDYRWPDGTRRVAGRATTSGGGFPTATLTLQPSRPASPFAGTLVMAPFAVPGARIALAPVRFASAAGGTRFATTVSVDGPLADGRIEGLTLPIAGQTRAGGGFVVDPGCVTLGFTRLALAGAQIGPTRLPLCPEGRALVWRAPGGTLAGGARISAPRLTGRLGGQPLTIAAGRLGIAIGRPGFTANALAVRLGTADAQSRLDIGSLAGTVSSGGIGGRFANLGGQIARVPLILSAGAGEWRLAHAALDLSGGLRVADEATAARFEPLVSDDLHLRLSDGMIAAEGWLKTPATGTRITRVALHHDLRAGRGDATLAVPGIAFTDALQPEALTRLTLGVVANVRGTVAGEGRIAWSAAGVVSTGTFGTESTDLAAAFGPVTGIRTTVHFTDLLGLVSAPAQEATIASVNPGVAATGGIVRYRLLPDQKVAVESARWPFSGGELELAPTVLDFSERATRRMTFRLTGIDAAKFVEQFDFKNVAVTGIFDGAMPITFDDAGGRIDKGRLAVRAGGGMLAYVGEISNKDLGMFGSLAFDALKRMRYDRLAIEMDGPLDGEIVSRLLFDGTNETPKEAVRKNGLLSQFANLPFRFRITVRAPFRGLLNSARSLSDPRGLIEQAMPHADTPLPGSSPATPSIQSR